MQELHSADESEESSGTTTASPAVEPAVHQGACVAALPPTQADLGQATPRAADMPPQDDQIEPGPGAGVASEKSLYGQQAGRASWDLSAEELAAASKESWPPVDGHAISLACFGCEGQVHAGEGVPSQRRVHESLVQQCDSLKPGDECLCLDPRDGQQWLATIKKITQHHAQVHYKGWSKSTDSWVTRDKLALKPTADVLQRIKLYNDHSKLKLGGVPKNQLSAGPSRPADSSASSVIDAGAPLEGREIRSRMRGVEMYSQPSVRYPCGQWRAVLVNGNQKLYIGNLFSSKEEAHKAWMEKAEKQTAASGGQAAKAKTMAERTAGREADAAASHAQASAPQASALAQASALGARVTVDGRRKGSVVIWISKKMLYQIRLDGSGALLHLPFPHKRLHMDKSSACELASGETRETVEHLLGGRNVLDEMQDICDTAWHEHVVGGQALQLARLRHLARACDIHGLHLSEAGINGSMEEVCRRLQVALHVALQPHEGDESEGAAGGDRHKKPLDEAELDRRSAELDRRSYSGVRSRMDGPKEEREFNKWEAFIQIGKKAYHLGYYSHKMEAARAWDMAAKRMLTKTTQLNLSDSRQSMPLPELAKTIEEIVKTEATSHVVRVVAPHVAGAGAVAQQLPPVLAARPPPVARKQSKLESGKSQARKRWEQRLGKRIQKARFDSKSEQHEGRRRSTRGQAPGEGVRSEALAAGSRRAGALRPSSSQGPDRPVRKAMVEKKRQPAGEVGSHDSQILPAPFAAAAAQATPGDPVLQALQSPLPPPSVDSLVDVERMGGGEVGAEAGGRRVVAGAGRPPQGDGGDGTGAQAHSLAAPVAAGPPPQCAAVMSMPVESVTQEQVQAACDSKGSEADEARQARARLKKPPLAGVAAAPDLALGSGGDKHPTRIRKRRRLFGEEEEEEEEEEDGAEACRKTIQRKLKQRIEDGFASAQRDSKKVKSEPADGGADALPAYIATGARCEVLWGDEWWAARVKVRKGRKLRVAYVGGTKQDDEWILDKDWSTRIRAPQEAAVEAGGGAAAYIGVVPSAKGLWNTVLDLPPVAAPTPATAAAPALPPQSHAALRSDSSEQADAVVGGEQVAAKAEPETRSYVVGTFTTAREAAEYWDCVVLELYGNVDTVDVQLNLDSSRELFRQCQAHGRAFVPDTFDDSLRAAAKDALLARALSQSAMPA